MKSKTHMTLRELVILKLSFNGFKDREIGSTLNLSPIGVQIIRNSGFKKLAEGMK